MQAKISAIGMNVEWLKAVDVNSVRSHLDTEISAIHLINPFYSIPGIGRSIDVLRSRDIETPSYSFYLSLYSGKGGLLVSRRPTICDVRGRLPTNSTIVQLIDISLHSSRLSGQFPFRGEEINLNSAALDGPPYDLREIKWERLDPGVSERGTSSFAQSSANVD